MNNIFHNFHAVGTTQSGRMLYTQLCNTFGNTVVPVMNGHPRDQAKVSVHCRWPLVTGTDGQAGDAKYNTPCNTTYYYTTSDIPNEYTHCHNHQTTARKFERSVGRKFGCAPAIFG